MNYEEKYKEALERARKLHSEPTGGTERIVCEQIFPELAESEDERMRKCIVAVVCAAIWNSEFSTSKDECLAWLEKQGEPIDKEKVKIGARKDLALSIINYLDDNRVAGCMDLSSMECEDIEYACVNSKWTKLYNYMKKKLETPDVSDYNPYEAAVKSIIVMTERYANGNDLKDFYNNVKVKCKDAINYDKIWSESKVSNNPCRTALIRI